MMIEQRKEALTRKFNQGKEVETKSPQLQLELDNLSRID
jgi:hypothetical protein